MTAEEAYSSWLSSQSVNREEIPVTPMAAFLAGYAARPAGDSGTRIADLEAKLAAAKKRLNGCQWYWPESDTSSECCGESDQEIVQNAYDWTANNAGEVVAVARGGIVEVTYCAALPPADDADSDDDFWVQESTKEAAEEKIAAELVRRAQVQPNPRSGEQS